MVPVARMGMLYITKTRLHLIYLHWDSCLAVAAGIVMRKRLGLVADIVNSNAWTLEKLLMHDSSVGMLVLLSTLSCSSCPLGSALTVLQLCFVVLYYLSSFLHLRHDVSYLKWLPRMERPNVSLRVWGLQVIVLTLMNLFNNW